jgi:hypothetical protein
VQRGHQQRGKGAAVSCFTVPYAIMPFHPGMLCHYQFFFCPLIIQFLTVTFIKLIKYIYTLKKTVQINYMDETSLLSLLWHGTTQFRKYESNQLNHPHWTFIAT